MFSKLLAVMTTGLVAFCANSAQAQTATIDSVISDMTQQSEALVIDPRYDWHYRSAVVQYAPSGTILPTWWAGSRPKWCYTALSWYTAYEAKGNAATNTRVQVRNLRMYVLLESTRKWKLIDTVAAPYTELWKYPFAYAGDFKAASVRTETSGGYSVKPVYPKFHHGYGTKKAVIPWDVRAVYIAMDFRLVVNNPALPDDRYKARYVVNAGGDYYPGNGVSWGVNYAPGIGGGRYLLATNNWRTANMLVPNKSMGATLTELRTNKPPMLALQ